MDLEKTKINANDIKKYVDKLISYYQEVVANLSSIKNILATTSLEAAKRVNDLIGRYNDIIKEFKESYVGIADNIINYVNVSNQNLSDLETSVARSAKEFNDVLGINDEIERLEI